MIDINKKHTTRDGKKVRLYADDGAGEYSIHGAIKFDDGWKIAIWNIRGGFALVTKTHPNDLVEVWEPQDKELVYAWDNECGCRRILAFYDAHNNRIFLGNGKRGGTTYDNYAKAPDCLQNEPWVIEARKKLED